MHMHMIHKSLKICCHSDANIKTNQEVKITKFKLLKHENLIFLQNFHSKKKKLHLHSRFFAIKDARLDNTHSLMYKI